MTSGIGYRLGEVGSIANGDAAVRGAMLGKEQHPVLNKSDQAAALSAWSDCFFDLGIMPFRQFPISV
ncbi:MAG: hypothetical protein DYG96_11280 [Chlorobi bacterium CHB2]|nr:hypothetical protein [Chlorobi bacterium CHB2]